MRGATIMLLLLSSANEMLALKMEGHNKTAEKKGKYNNSSNCKTSRLQDFDFGNFHWQWLWLRAEGCRCCSQRVIVVPLLLCWSNSPPPDVLLQQPVTVTVVPSALRHTGERILYISLYNVIYTISRFDMY